MRKLTPKESRYIDNIIDGMTQSEAYRQAGYKVDVMSVQSIAKAASRIADKPHIKPIIAKRRKEMADKAIWGREEALKMLRDIAVEAMENAVVGDEGKTYYSATNANTAIKAIEQANKMCGYNEAEKHKIDAGIVVELGKAREYAE